MKNAYILLATLFFSTAIFAQQEYWQTSYVKSAGIPATNAGLIEKDFTFVSVSGKAFYENSYFLELDRFATLPLEGGSFNGHYFHLSEVENNGDLFYFATQRNGETNGKIYLNTLDLTGIPIEQGVELTDNLISPSSKGPAVARVTDETFLIFGNQSFHKINLSNTGVISVEWSKGAVYGLIADAQAYNGGYILCSGDGKLVQVDNEAEEVWMKDLGMELRAVLVVADGFVMTTNSNGGSGLTKTDFDGNILWEKQYEGSPANDLDFAHDGGFVFTGKHNSNIFVVKTDAEGELVWSHEYTHGEGLNIIKSQYGGYIVQGNNGLITNVLRIDDEGSTGDLISKISESVLEVNNVRTTASPDGNLFWDRSNTNTTFPQGASTSTLFAGGLWISGFDQNGERHASITRYYNTDFQPGPFNSDGESWNNVWRINKEKINILREDFADGEMNRPIPFDMITYPGSGNPNFNFMGGSGSVPDNMAPFIDVNNDGVYNVFDGDYPDITGDEMLWWVMNDKNGGNGIGGVPFDFEIKCSLFAYACGENPILQNAAFLEVDITNYSDNEYSDVYVGTMVDFDIGCYLDDYVGTLVSTNSVYGYNQDIIDGVDDSDDCSNESAFAENQIPIQSFTYLNTSLDYSIHFHYNITGPVYEWGVEQPTTPEDLHDFLQATWTDGTPQTIGGYGYGGTEPSDYAFPGNPANANEWSLCTSGASDQDRKLVAVTGPKTLAPDEILELDMGLLTHENINYPCPDISQVASEIQQMQNLYETGGLDYDLFLGPDMEIMTGETIVLDAGTGAVSYVWSTGATSQTLEVVSSGNYSVTVTTTSGCEYTDEIAISGFIGLNEVQSNAPKIYPNPASSQIFVILTDDIPQYITLENTLGQQIKNYEVATGSQHSTLELSLGNLPQGMYLLRFHYKEEGKKLLRKVVLAK